MRFTGTADDDIVTGTDDPDRFDLDQGGSDTVYGGRGHDRFLLGAALDAHDRLNGGGGNDRLYLDGDYSGANALVCHNSTLRKIETIWLGGGHSYDLTFADGNFGDKGGVVNASGLGAGDTLHLDLSAETSGDFSVLGSAGDDTIVGGQSDDIFDTRTGNDDVDGQSGDDVMSMGGPDRFGSGDHYDGGAHTDQLLLAGEYSSQIHITAAMLQSVEELQLADPHDYDIVIDDGVIAGGDTLSVSGIRFGGSVDSFTLDGSAETNGRYAVTGSDGNDTILVGAGDDAVNGGAGNDTIDGDGGIDDLTGGAGADTITGGSDIDRFHYNAVSESASTTHDTITDFDVADDFFDLHVTVDGYDGQTSGAVSAATFDANLTVASAGHFALAGTARAIVVNANSGDLSGHSYLIVDVNGDKAYSANADYVIDITGASNLASLLVSNFI